MRDKWRGVSEDGWVMGGGVRVVGMRGSGWKWG